MKYTFRGKTIDFGQPNQKGQGQTKEQWIDSRMGVFPALAEGVKAVDVFDGVIATDAEKRAALADVWDKLASERAATEKKPAKVVEIPKEVKK